MILTLGTTPAVQMSMSFAVVTTDAVNRAEQTRRYASGKSINATRVLRTLGRDVCALGFAGGAGGEFLRTELAAMGASHGLVEVRAPTRTCVTVIDRSTRAATELIEEPGEVDGSAYVDLVDALRTGVANADGLLLAGSLPPNAPADFYADCMAVSPAGLHTVIDAKGLALSRALRRQPTVVKPNLSELSETVGRAINTDEDLKTAVRRMVDLGPRWVVVTDGPRPATVSDGSTFYRMTSPPVKVVSPIGSGDSFAAGLLAGLCGGRSVPDACRLASACGSANAMTDISGGLSVDVVAALESRVQLTPF